MVLCSVLDIGKKLAEKCIEPVAGYVKTEVGHVLSYSTNIEKLREEGDNLSDAVTSVHNRIKEAENSRGETVVEATVERWLKRTTSLNEEVSKIIRDEERETERCLLGLRPNLWACYLASKLARKAIDEAVKLVDEGKRFERVASVDYWRCLGVTPIPDFEEFESRVLVSDQIVASLKDSSVNTVGVYGMGGVGKTTLAEKIGADLQLDGTFTYVVMAVVSNQQKTDLVHIQKQIADLLKINLKEKDDIKARANHLREQLEKKEKLLIILDDIWSRFDLKDVGLIPVGNASKLHNRKQFKVLMTSRSELVLRSGMDSTYNFALDSLSCHDAQNLFDRMVGGDGEYSDWRVTAQQVVDRCGGIPIILATIAKALRNADMGTWEDALTQLKNFDGEDFVEEAYKRIEVSYNFLKIKEMKKLFLLCAQLDHHSIPIEDLLKYTMGLDLFEGLKKLKEVSSRLHKYLRDLKGCCLLQDGNTEGTLRMHDVVHRFAAVVASRDHVFSIADGELHEWPSKDELEQFSAISLPFCHLPPHHKLPEAFDNSKLESFLLLRRKRDVSLKIPDNFFMGMKGLKLMDVRKMHLSPVLPSSLRTLCLDHCELDDVHIAMIAELPMLQVLSLVGSNIARLPKEIGKLVRLKLLDLCDCSRLKVIESDVFSKLTLLEDLRIFRSFNQWEQLQGCSLEEFKNLRNLINLDIHIPDPKTFPKNLFFEKLERFRIFIGEGWYSDGGCKLSRTLKLNLNEGVQLDEGIKVLTGIVEDLKLEQLKGFTSLCELDPKCFPQLKHLHAHYGVEIQYIVKNSYNNCVVFPKLESLDLLYLKKLERISDADHLQRPVESFQNLTSIKVRSCNVLKDVFSSHLARCLICLKEIRIEDCESIETLIVSRGSENRSDEGGIIEFSQLRELRLNRLPRLISFYSTPNPILSSPLAGQEQLAEIVHEQLTSPTPLFSKKIVFPKLEELELGWIKVEKIWDDQLEIAAGSTYTCWFQNLRSLEVQHCDNLSYLFTSSMVRSLVQLKKLKIKYCKSIEEIVATTLGEMAGEMLLFPNLDYIELEELPKLKSFFHANLLQCQSSPQMLAIIEAEKIWHDQVAIAGGRTCWFQNLTSLEVNQCGNLSYLFTSFMVKNLAQLKKLKIKNCKCMEEIVATRFRRMAGDEMFSFPKLEELVLESLPKLERFCHANLLECQSLRDLWIQNCPELNAFISTNDSSPAGLEENSSTCLFDEKVALPNLEILAIHNMHQLKVIWGNQLHPNSFPKSNLRTVTVSKCSAIKSLFPAFFALTLQQLEELKIRECRNMKEIVSKDQEKNEEEEEYCVPHNRFVFPRLTSVGFWDLPKLERFYPGPHISDWPSLDKLDVWGCDKIDTFGLNIQQLDASFTKIISSSKDCHLHRTDMTLTYKSLSGELKVDGVEYSHVFPFALLQTFQKLEKVEVSRFSIIQVFSCGPGLGDDDDMDTQAKTLARIQYLNLIDLPDMKHIWGEHSQLGGIPQDLKIIHVLRCGSLMSLAPPTALFQNLKSLTVRRCNGLIKLVASSTAKSLVNLTEMWISECDSLTDIVTVDHGGEEEASNKDIVFGKLESLKLQYLTSLTSFCSVINCNFQFPSLYEVIVVECPKMEFFSKGALSTPKLSTIWVNKEDEEAKEGRWEGNLYSTVQKLYREMVGLRSTEWLRLSEFPKLKEIWLDEFPVQKSSELRFLEVDDCDTFVSYALSSSFLLCLDKLEVLRVTNCNSLEEVFDGSKEYLELMRNRDVGLLSNLDKLYLADLPSLRHLWLEHFEGILDFKNLTLLNICNCSSLRYVFTSSMVVCLVHLQEIQVENCTCMEEIIFLDAAKGVGMRWDDNNILTFPQLSSLLLRSLPCLSTFYFGNGVLDCPCLEKITMIDCPKMESFTSTSLGEKQASIIEANNERLGNKDLHASIKPLFNDKVAFPNLEALKIIEMDGLKMIWEDELHPNSFSELKTLEIEKGKALLSIFPCGMLGRLLNLENLTISKCETVVKIFDVQMPMNIESKLHCEVQACQLETLHISELPKLKHVWNDDPYELVSFQNLRSVSVEKCPTLTSLFPVSVALGLQQLEELQIESCGGMEEIVSVNEEDHPESHEFVFPNLTLLRLWESPELKRLYPGSHTSEWPSLNDLNIYHCDKIDLFGPKFQSIRVEDCKDQEHLGIQVHQQPFLSFTKIFPNLEEIPIRSKDVEMLYDEACLCLADKVRVIDLQCFHHDSQVFPIELLQRFHNLSKLHVSCSNFKQLFPSELLADETNVKTLSRIPQLMADYLPEMTHIWDEESDQLNQILQNLEDLEVWDCNRLITLAPSAALFPNLTSLVVHRCEQLVKLVTSSSTAKSFVQLKKLQLCECDSLTEIVAIDGEETSNEDDIVFGKLESLKLQSLTSLTSFSSTTNCNFQFPFLYFVIVEECFKMKFFSNGALSTPKMSKVWVKLGAEEEVEEEEGEEEGRWRWEGDLDSTIREMYQEMVGAMDDDNNNEGRDEDEDEDEDEGEDKEASCRV